MFSFCSNCTLSSIVKKQIMGVTGLLLCGFLVVHLAGNCLIYFGPEAFNTYAHLLMSNPFIEIAEVGLALLFLTHIFFAVVLTVQNKRARGGQNYYASMPTEGGATFASSTMPYTGTITLIFLIFHLWHIKFGPEYSVVYSGVEMRDFYRLLINYFASPPVVVWYLFAQICLGIHVAHGFWSAFQSLGFSHPRYTRCLKVIARIYAMVIAVGFSALPIYLCLEGGS